MMNSRIQQINKYGELNSMAVQRTSALLGSSFMVQFPFGEIAKILRMEECIYNRSVEELKVSEANEIYRLVVEPLNPQKLFLSLGEVEVAEGESFYREYEDLITYIQATAPRTEIFLLPVFSSEEKSRESNEAVMNLARKYKVQYVDLMKDIQTLKKRDLHLCLTDYIRIWSTIYMYTNGKIVG